MIKKNIYDCQEIIQLIDLSDGYRLNDFSCGQESYDEFLRENALLLQNHKISKVHLLINKTNADIIAYMSLSADVIKLTEDEKESYEMIGIPFQSIPAVKIGHLAVDQEYQRQYRNIGSIMIELARGICMDMRTHGVACRFITVDADIDNNPSVCDFYIKNGFKPNENYSKRKSPSLRLDIDGDVGEIALTNLA